MSQKVICLSVLLSLLGWATSVSADLVGYWPLDEGSGTIAHDLSGNGNDGTLMGNPQWSDRGILFDGVDDWIDLGNPAELPDGTSPRSVCVWAMTQSLGSDLNVLMGYGSPVTAQAFGFGRQDATLIGFAWGNSVRMQNFFEIGMWYHLCLTYDGATAILYANGEALVSEPKVWNLVRSLACIGRQINGTQYWTGGIADVRIYDHTLTPAEIQAVIRGEVGLASGPNPADGATDVPRDVVLNWTPGEFANTHDVYLSAVFDDVNNASRANPLGVLAGQGQSPTIYDPPGRLDFGQTYYWRIDEVNAPPTSTIFKGDVWSFTVEPLAYPIENIIATASSANKANEGPQNTVNGSGLNADDMHSVVNTDMWLSNIAGPQPTWIQYEFDKVYKLHQMWAWNYNSSTEPVVGFGVKEATIEYSADGTNWTTLGTTHEFARGPGADDYAPNTTVDLGGVAAKYVKITANSNWGGILNQYGLSEVRFLYIPVSAREPDPASGATDVSVAATLSWGVGREAVKHDVYLSTDAQAVIDGTAPAVTVTSPNYPSSLDLAGTYYWRVDEVNDAETPSTWQGDVWSLSTQEYLVVDDFESYNDIEAGKEGSNLVYVTWVDGFGTTTNGSTIGYTEAFQPSMETSTVYDGKQSVPFFYNNTIASISEITASVANLQAGQDWSKHGIKALTLRFFGDPNNVPQQMYVKVNGAKVTYDGNAENTGLKGWQMWYIDLASFGVNLSNVTTLTIGFERIGTVAAQGMVLLDAIRLYSYDRQMITPVDPGTAGSQAQYQFEGNTSDSSGNGRNGTAQGDPIFVAGKIGQAISLDGFNDYVNIDGYKGILGSSAVTVTAWVRTSSTVAGAIAGWGPNIAGQRFGFRVDAGRLRLEHHGGNIQADTLLSDGGWHHVAVTVQANATISYPEVILYLDGADDTRPTTDPDAFNLTAAEDVSIGRRPASNDRFFMGQIDEVRIYSRALTQEEIAWLSGRTKPFDRSF